jgi:hypothetical protein
MASEDDGRYPGPNCRKFSISADDLLNDDVSPLTTTQDLSNGLVLELNRFGALKKLSLECVTAWVIKLLPENVKQQHGDLGNFSQKIRSAIQGVHKKRNG